MRTEHGKIIFFNKKSRFGFIRNFHDNKNYYVHEKNFLENLDQEDEVEFELTETEKGMEATKVKKISEVKHVN